MDWLPLWRGCEGLVELRVETLLGVSLLGGVMAVESGVELLLNCRGGPYSEGVSVLILLFQGLQLFLFDGLDCLVPFFMHALCFIKLLHGV